MANDPNRDILPVKEDCYRTGKVLCEKFDHHLVGKLSRCELEDRFLRLLDEQTHIKKVANCQEEKIKRLGTKLIRLLNEKKNGSKSRESGKEAEDLHLRIIELEHENYALKDKNIVLKQQLASHSRHLSSHRFPTHSSHTSPLVSVRQPAPQTQSENGLFDTTNKNRMADIQLQEAEAHIGELNNEIKSLHNKIDFLQQNLEKNSLDSQKVKVTENIELIRLQRSLKQQSIQITSLQAQIKNSENNQKMLKEELTRAYKANDEALYLLSEKQNEILNLCSKLEEKNLDRLEETELKQRINDLMIERDCLKERSDFLISAIGTKTEESEKIKELKQLLAEEKEKKEKLEETLEVMTKCITKSPRRNSGTGISRNENTNPPEKHYRGEKRHASLSQNKEEVVSPSDNSEESEYSSSKVKCNCYPETYPNPEPESDTESRETIDINTMEAESRRLNGKHAAEKMKLERELQYLREMLRSQTSRCEAQQAEICRLMYELKLNESKCNETLRKLDMHLTIFEKMEMQPRQYIKSSNEPVKLKKDVVPEKSMDIEKSEKLQDALETYPTREVINDNHDNSNAVIQLTNNARRYVSEVALPGRLTSKDQIESKNLADISPKEPDLKATEPESKKRFVDQRFLDSSEEDLENEEKSSRKSFIEKLQELKDQQAENPSDAQEPVLHNRKLTRSSVLNKGDQKRALSSSSTLEDSHSNIRLSNDNFTEGKKERNKFKSSPTQLSSEEITISILWLKINPEGSLWKNDKVKFFFIDFTFLDVNGEETETPESLPKPTNPEELCYFNFASVIQMPRYRKEIFNSLIGKPDVDLIIFKVVSDSENADESSYECEDVGVAVIKPRKFMEHLNKDMFTIPVRNPENKRELVGKLAVKIKGTSKLISS